MIQVRLLKHYRHIGRMWVPGDVLGMDDTTARWLIDQRIADDVRVTIPINRDSLTSTAKPGRVMRKCCGWK